MGREWKQLHQFALLLDGYLEIALLEHVFVGLLGFRQLGIAEFRGLFIFLEAYRNHDHAERPSCAGVGNGAIHGELHFRWPPFEGFRRHLARQHIAVCLPISLVDHFDAVDAGHHRNVGVLLHQLLRNGKVHLEKRGRRRWRIERERKSGSGPSPSTFAWINPPQDSVLMMFVHQQNSETDGGGWRWRVQPPAITTRQTTPRIFFMMGNE